MITTSEQAMSSILSTMYCLNEKIRGNTTQPLGRPSFDLLVSGRHSVRGDQQSVSASDQLVVKMSHAHCHLMICRGQRGSPAYATYAAHFEVRYIILDKEANRQHTNDDTESIT